MRRRDNARHGVAVGVRKIGHKAAAIANTHDRALGLFEDVLLPLRHTAEIPPPRRGRSVRKHYRASTLPSLWMVNAGGGAGGAAFLRAGERRRQQLLGARDHGGPAKSGRPRGGRRPRTTTRDGTFAEHAAHHFRDAAV